MTTPLVELYHNHIKFSDGNRDYLPQRDPERARELKDLREQASQFLDKYQHTNVELAHRFKDATPDQWEGILHAEALEHIKGEIVQSIFPQWLKDLYSQIKEARRDSKAYVELLEGVDTAEDISIMETSCGKLKGTHHNMSDAIRVDPVAYRNFREAGRKLSQLSILANFGDLKYNLHSTPELMVALYADPRELPALKASETGREGVHEAHYTEEQLQLHDQIAEARSLVATPGKRDLFLAELAAGRWPALTFSIAPTINELKRRASIIEDAGTIHIV